MPLNKCHIHTQFSKEERDLHGRPGKAHWAAWGNSRRRLGDVSGQERSNPDADKAICWLYKLTKLIYKLTKLIFEVILLLCEFEQFQVAILWGFVPTEMNVFSASTFPNQSDVSLCTESLISAHPPAQVDAIRDSSLARVLCENGDDIQLMQPLVFKAPTDMWVIHIRPG